MDSVRAESTGRTSMPSVFRDQDQPLSSAPDPTSRFTKGGRGWITSSRAPVGPKVSRVRDKRSASGTQPVTVSLPFGVIGEKLLGSGRRGAGETINGWQGGLGRGAHAGRCGGFESRRPLRRSVVSCGITKQRRQQSIRQLARGTQWHNTRASRTAGDGAAQGSLPRRAQARCGSR